MESLLSFDEGLEVLPTRKVDTHCREPFLDLREIGISAADTEDEFIENLRLKCYNKVVTEVANKI